MSLDLNEKRYLKYWEPGERRDPNHPFWPNLRTTWKVPTLIYKARTLGYLAEEDTGSRKFVRTNKEVANVPDFKRPAQPSLWPYTKIHHWFLMHSSPVTRHYFNALGFIELGANDWARKRAMLKAATCEYPVIYTQSGVKKAREYIRRVLPLSGYPLSSAQNLDLTRYVWDWRVRNACTCNDTFSIGELLAILLVKAVETEDGKYNLEALPREDQLDALREAREQV